MSFTSSAITSTAVQQDQHGLPGAEPQNHEKPVPATGKQADHPLYRSKSSMEQSIRGKLPGAPGSGSAGKRNPRAAAGTRAPESPDHVAAPFLEASSAPHIALLNNTGFRNAFVKSLGELGKIAVKSGKTKLTSTDWNSAYRYYDIAVWLNERCAKKLQGSMVDMAANLGPHIVKTASVLKWAFESVQDNRAGISGIRSMLLGEDKR